MAQDTRNCTSAPPDRNIQRSDYSSSHTLMIHSDLADHKSFQPLEAVITSTELSE